MAWLAQVPPEHKEVALRLSPRPTVAPAWKSCSLVLQGCGAQDWEMFQGQVFVLTPWLWVISDPRGAICKMGLEHRWALAQQPVVTGLGSAKWEVTSDRGVFCHAFAYLKENGQYSSKEN